MPQPPPVDLPPIFCIGLARAVDRRRRMERRFAHHGLSARVRWVEAFAISEEGMWEGDWTDRASQACFASHIEAMRQALELPEVQESGAIICEDDCLFHNEFVSRAQDALANIPTETPVCSLGALTPDWERLRWAGLDPDRHNICALEWGTQWGSHLYWVSPGHAQALVDRWGDAAMEDLPCVTETMLIRTGSLAAYPSLALQDALDSFVRSVSDQEAHVSGQEAWPYEDYSASEEGDDRSPLAKLPAAHRSIGLAMIVRDEAETIGRCIASVRPLISSWTICDTGSKDGTPELIEKLLAGMPGELHHRPWRNFGENRSELMELAKGSADYLLLVDADMTVQSRGPLPPLKADAYSLRHEGDLDYSIPRLVRGNRDWHYEGPTHEYLTSRGEWTQEGLAALAIVHHGDSGTRGEKFERDERLLEKQLASDPNNERAVFYLAQTVRDMGDVDRAVELYLRRAELGGFEEEAYYAAYQAGVLAGRSDPDRGIELLRSAAERRPQRGEALYELSRLLRLRGRHEEALAFARKGAELPYPDDMLFVHRDVHEWGLRLEQAIAAHFAGNLTESLEAGEAVLRRGGLPGPVSQAARETHTYSLSALGRADGYDPAATRRLDQLVPSARTGEIRLEVEPAWPQFNPSIASDGDGFRMIVRTANYRIVGGRYEIADDVPDIRTLNYVAYLDGDLELRNVRALADEVFLESDETSLVRGYEDCRLFEFRGRWYAVANVRDRNPQMRCEVVLLTLDDDRVESARVLPGPDPDRNEKNWMPFVRDDELALVYSCDPTVVFECDPETAAVTRLAEGRPAVPLGELRGGSQGVPVPGGHLFVVHEAYGHGITRAYTHRFVLLDESLQLSAWSPRFTFTGARIEICTGMAQRDGRLVLSFGVNDANAALAVSDEGAILDLLEPIKSGPARAE